MFVEVMAQKACDQQKPLTNTFCTEKDRNNVWEKFQNMWLVVNIELNTFPSMFTCGSIGDELTLCHKIDSRM